MAKKKPSKKAKLLLSGLDCQVSTITAHAKIYEYGRRLTVPAILRRGVGGLVIGVLALLSIIVTIGPARRAARVDPMIGLRGS